MKTILVAEDDLNIQNILAFNLEREGYKVFTAENGKEALDLFNDEDKIDLVLLDLMMPEMNGYDFIRKFREFSDIPVIMITALESENNKLEGFNLGADDYIVKPFSVREVIARVELQLHKMELIKGNIKSIIEESENLSDKQNLSGLKIADLFLDIPKHIVIRDKKEIKLSEREFSILMLLYKNSDKMFDRDALLKEIWNNDGTNTRTVDVTIRRLREKIEIDAANPVIIKSRRGMGYYLDLRG